MNRSRRARGFSLVELLVVMGILSLLLGLALPAVQSAREAARRLACASNLRNVAAAWHQYHDAHRMLPPTLGPGYRGTGTPSWAFSVLPFLEQQLVFDGVNVDPVHYTFAVQRSSPPALATALATALPIFLCPSDPSPLATGINYRANGGVGPAVSPDFHGPDSGNGVVRSYGSNIVAFRDIVDGLSATAMLSERVRGSNAGPLANAFQDIFYPGASIPDGCYGSADDSLRIALISAESAGGIPQVDFAGWAWLAHGIDTVVYKHGQEPNGTVPDMACGSDGGCLGLVAARSWHPGVVTAAFADGSTRAISDNISRPLWRALGTRNGREPLAEY